MDAASKVVAQQLPKRIGILLADMGKLNVPALKYLVLHMNTLQKIFEYEFLPVNFDDELLRKLTKYTSINRDGVEAEIPEFLNRYKRFLKEEIRSYELSDVKLSTDHFIIVSMACFEDNYYSSYKSDLSILALGNWKDSMAPPSLIEFILTLILRESVPIISPSLGDSVHLGTRGCLFDFTASIGDVRLKVLNGFVCSYCRAVLEADGYGLLANDLVYVLQKSWLGKSTDPNTPAGIATNLGYDLFLTKGLKATAWESLMVLLQQEGMKQLIAILGAIFQFILIALLILWLGLKK